MALNKLVMLKQICVNALSIVLTLTALFYLHLTRHKQRLATLVRFVICQIFLEWSNKAWYQGRKLWRHDELTTVVKATDSIGLLDVLAREAECRVLH